MTRELLAMPRAAAFTRLVEQHSLDNNAAENLLRYLEDQTAATGRVPSDRDIVIERCRDELGDFRVCVLTPFGSRVHAPWCMAVTARLRHERGVEVETMWTDDGFVIAEKDLELRGAGELLGTRQSGMENFRIADVTVHGELLAAARDDAQLILTRDPELHSERGQALRTLLYLFGRDEAVRYLKAG